MNRSYGKSANRKAFQVLTGQQTSTREKKSNVVLFKHHFLIISTDGQKSWHTVASAAGSAA